MIDLVLERDCSEAASPTLLYVKAVIFKVVAFLETKPILEWSTLTWETDMLFPVSSTPSRKFGNRVSRSNLNQARACWASTQTSYQNLLADMRSRCRFADPRALQSYRIGYLSYWPSAQIFEQKYRNNLSVSTKASNDAITKEYFNFKYICRVTWCKSYRESDLPGKHVYNATLLATTERLPSWSL